MVIVMTITAAIQTFINSDSNNNNDNVTAVAITSEVLVSINGADNSNNIVGNVNGPEV